ncbi:MAG: glycosyltransferase family 2 protein, partial [Candidatus Limnocylindrales bacterium]
RLLDLPRVGKADALNAAVAVSSGEILVFTDANTRFAPDAIEALIAPFADPEVGGVAGDQRYVKATREDGIAQGERGYWDLDRMLKIAESRAGNVVSATGAIYAIRRELFRPVVSGVTDDFITSVAVVAQGRRLVFAEDAVAFEPPARSGGDEFGRKVRIMTRGLRGTLLMRGLMDPRRYGFYAFQLAWHKLFRRLMVVPLIGLLLSSVALLGRGPLYTLAALAQICGYALGVAGLSMRGRATGHSRLLSLPAFFILVNAAALKALVDVARGRRIDRWDPVRSVVDSGVEEDAR